jgi:hypothetical protein
MAKQLFENSHVVGIVFLNNRYVPVKLGSYKEFTPEGGGIEVFVCKNDTYPDGTNNLIGPTENIMYLRFADPESAE